MVEKLDLSDIVLPKPVYSVVFDCLLFNIGGSAKIFTRLMQGVFCGFTGSREGFFV
ncbi:hypothetical protein SMSP2_02712 [Limihaloglobus sulfuriphilus]|uniref:Uncharacterized protein n=1 Tax=Limihaloglobus sulfuriphilus TaxID=1851148 RepID=A0A1Q2MI51_9BACT|nr:hypothetical protein [Limihaloglobus sulfuriphilus]AQQ72329.1 hypothetical protein SMSP2_02712 [Limihaloglobus sulfuriphilus]